jgi:uncharacterized membrane protein
MATIAGLFTDRADARSAIEELHSLGTPGDSISVIAPKGATPTEEDGSLTVRDAEKGAVVGGLAGFLLGLSELAVPGVGLVLVGGWLAAALIGAGVGAATGGLAGALAEAGLSHEAAGHMTEGVRSGKTLVTVRTATERPDVEEAVLLRHHAVNIQIRTGAP